MTRDELQAVLEDATTETNSKITTILNQVNSEREIAVNTAVNDERLNSERIELQLQESNEALEKLRKTNGDNEGLQKTIDELNQKQSELQAKYDDLKIDSEIKLALTETGARNVTIAALALDKDLIKLDKDGELVGLKEQIDKLKSSEDTSFLFDEPAEKKETAEPIKEETKRQTYNPAKGDKPVAKSQGAELGDRILAERKNHQDQMEQNIKGTY